jgi:hypothetical protein
VAIGTPTCPLVACICLPLIMNMATPTNAVAIAISNTQSPSIGCPNVGRERGNLRYLRFDRSQDGSVEFRHEVAGQIGRL